MADIDVSFACNDHRNGNSLHRFEHVEFSEEAAECECALWGPWTSVRVHLQKRPGQKFATVTVGNRIYRIKGYRSHEGNWCWDAVCLAKEDARALLKQLLEIGFHVEQWATRGPLADLLSPVQAAQ